MQFLPLCLVPFLCAAVFSAPMDNFTLDPSCNVMKDYAMISCFLIDAGSISVMTDALKNASSWDDISLLLALSAVNQLPVDTLASAPLRSLTFGLNCTLEGIPSALLREVSAPLKDLQFVNVLGFSRIALGDLDDMGFSETLESLVLKTQQLNLVEGSAFQQLSHLKTLTITGTSLSSLPADTLMGLADLEEITLTYNPLTTLPSGFSAVQGSLRNVWLGQNQLTTLEEGSLDGLDGILMLDVAGNPFNCECSLQWFKDWLTARNLLDASGATCATPTAGKFSDVDFCA